MKEHELQTGILPEPEAIKSEPGLTVNDLQEDARVNGGRIMTPDEFRPYLGGMHHMLEGVEYITVDTTGRVGYHARSK